MTHRAHPVLRLAAGDHVRLRDWADEAAPEEACGLLLGRMYEGETEVLRVLRGCNQARTPRDAFELAPEEVLRAAELGRDSGLELVGLWHSHPGAPAVLSAADRHGLSAGWSFVVLPADPGEHPRSWRELEGEIREETVRVDRRTPGLAGVV
jgi:proteasome lid subunit RPN8/RPN11